MTFSRPPVTRSRAMRGIHHSQTRLTVPRSPLLHLDFLRPDVHPLLRPPTASLGRSLSAAPLNVRAMLLRLDHACYTIMAGLWCMISASEKGGPSPALRTKRLRRCCEGLRNRCASFAGLAMCRARNLAKHDFHSVTPRDVLSNGPRTDCSCARPPKVKFEAILACSWSRFLRCSRRRA